MSTVCLRIPEWLHISWATVALAIVVIALVSGLFNVAPKAPEKFTPAKLQGTTSKRFVISRGLDPQGREKKPLQCDLKLSATAFKHSEWFAGGVPAWSELSEKYDIPLWKFTAKDTGYTIQAEEACTGYLAVKEDGSGLELVEVENTKTTWTLKKIYQNKYAIYNTGAKKVVVVKDDGSLGVEPIRRAKKYTLYLNSVLNKTNDSA